LKAFFYCCLKKSASKALLFPRLKDTGGNSFFTTEGNCEGAFTYFFTSSTSNSFSATGVGSANFWANTLGASYFNVSTGAFCGYTYAAAI
jgi:hypothetical protein